VSENDVLLMIQGKLCSFFDIRRMILFGSRARGEAAPGSDFDLLVIADSDVPFIERQGLALLALGKRDFAVDLLVYTQAEAEVESQIPGSAV
jgi:predicted nucleotidyltransferase